MSKAFTLSGIYVGWPKCGSTWLFRFLEAHPECAVPKYKDTHYFDRYHARGREWLEGQFGEKDARRKACVDIGHDYIFSEDALARIGAEDPQATIFVGLREPSSWLRSEYAYVSGTGRVSDAFPEYLINYPYALSHARYEVHLKNLLKYVDHKNIRFLFLEDLTEDPVKFAKDVTDGLSLSADMSSFFDLTSMVNKQLVARNENILLVAKTVSSLGERIGLRGLVQAAKRGPLRDIVFKPAQTSRSDPAPELLRAYGDQFRNTVEAVSEIAKVDLHLKWKPIGC